MSAVPVAVEAFGGTSDLAFSVALYLSANAGPAKATAAANESTANMVLVMALSLLTSDYDTRFQNIGIPILFPKSARSPLNFRPASGWSGERAGRKVRATMTVG